MPRDTVRLLGQFNTSRALILCCAVCSWTCSRDYTQAEIDTVSGTLYANEQETIPPLSAGVFLDNSEEMSGFLSSKSSYTNKILALTGSIESIAMADGNYPRYFQFDGHTTAEVQLSALFDSGRSSPERRGISKDIFSSMPRDPVEGEQIFIFSDLGARGCTANSGATFYLAQRLSARVSDWLERGGGIFLGALADSFEGELCADGGWRTYSSNLNASKSEIFEDFSKPFYLIGFGFPHELASAVDRLPINSLKTSIFLDPRPGDLLVEIESELLVEQEEIREPASARSFFTLWNGPASEGRAFLNIVTAPHHLPEMALEADLRIGKLVTRSEKRIVEFEGTAKSSSPAVRNDNGYQIVLEMKQPRRGTTRVYHLEVNVSDIYLPESIVDLSTSDPTNGSGTIYLARELKRALLTYWRDNPLARVVIAVK